MLVNAFGQFVARLDYQSLPAAVVEAVKTHILDTLGSGLAGCRMGNHLPLITLFGEPGSVTVWGQGRRFPLRDAALLNSFLAHSTYLDDGSRFSGGHPSSVVLPSVLALAEAHGLSGQQLIVAVAAGYEVFLRLGRAIYPSAVTRGFQPTAVLGAVASAAGCASLLGLDARASKNAMAIAASLGVGLKEALKCSASQPLQVGRSAEGGLLAALYARAGAEGADTIIEQGFFKAFADSLNDDRICDGLGTTFRIFETYIKIHGGCRGNHAPVDVVRTIMAENDLAPERIESIAVEVDSITLAAEIDDPINGAQAQFSIPFAVAVALLKGNASVFQYTDENANDGRIRSLMKRIAVTADPALDHDYPNRRGARAALVLDDGRRFTHYLENAKGEPELALTQGEVEKKFFILADGLRLDARRIRDLMREVETLPDVGELTSLLRVPDDR
jgi:2-methylcitrate dehydratase PrpD